MATNREVKEQLKLRFVCIANSQARYAHPCSYQACDGRSAERRENNVDLTPSLRQCST